MTRRTNGNPTGMLIVAAVHLAASLPATAAISPKQAEFFEKRVRPVLAEHCYRCHSDQEGKSRGGLVLDSKSGWERGGDSGPVISPGDPGASRLIQAVRYDDESLQMPPKDKKLPARAIRDLEAWVRMGAPDPRTGPSVAAGAWNRAQDHWAFQPVTRPSIPEPADQDWVRTPIDAFILARLEANGLRPNPPADQRTLIRRAGFDLAGLPPSVAEFEAFQRDSSKDAFAQVIDRQLDSPRYGERWGRHWLDVARYADTKGTVNKRREDRRYPYAWTYRDYVIDAFNNDKPFNRFILEQIAADKLELEEKDPALAALGFLTVGKRFDNSLNDIIDDRIDAVTKGFMALTVTCARCHDHKFDPIPTADYYSLHGIFNSTVEPDELPLLQPPTDASDYHEYRRRFPFARASAKAYRDNQEGKIRKRIREQTVDYWTALVEIPRQRGNRRRMIEDRGLDRNVYRNWDNHFSAIGDGHDPVLTPWIKLSRIHPDTFARSARSAADAFASNAYPGRPINPLVAALFQRGPLQSLSDLANRYRALFEATENRWLKELDAARQRNRPRPERFENDDWEEVRQIIMGDDSPANPPDEEVFRRFSKDEQKTLVELEGKVIDYLWQFQGAQGRAMVVRDMHRPRDSHIFIKGDAKDRGREVPRRFLEVLAGPRRKPFLEGSGRLELARSIASPDNPLTARTIVNRVWMHHFGEGLVATVDDLGTRSEPPSHPQLLDWLAGWFMDNGWSIKELHRLIMGSSVYQQASEENPRYAQVDPGNRLLWRFNVRRLDFEALRDSLLAIGGKLDTTMGGPPVELTAVPYSARRTVYGLVDRADLDTLYTTFDFANPDLPTGQRHETTVPQQALFLMNNPLVVAQAKALVTRDDFLSQGTDEERIRRLYYLIYQRDPTDQEIQLAGRYLTAQGSIVSDRILNPTWQYGSGMYDSDPGRVTRFDPLPHFVTRQETWLDASGKQGPVMLNAKGGHPGLFHTTAAIRRWTAPFEGIVVIGGTIQHSEEKGDGVVARIVSSREGELARAIAHNDSHEIKAEATVLRDDTIDFVVEPRRVPRADSFEWTPTIRMVYVSDDVNQAGLGKEWSAETEFAGPATPERSLAVWERYAQVLLLTNEMTFYN